MCITDSAGKVVGTGAVLVERKFIHNLGMVGHIEDIAVAKDQQGKKLGLRIIQALDHVAEKVGCYKVRIFVTGNESRKNIDTDSFRCTVNPRLLRSERRILCQVWV